MANTYDMSRQTGDSTSEEYFQDLKNNSGDSDELSEKIEQQAREDLALRNH